MSRILLVGSTGFIGRPLAAHLAHCGHEIIPLSHTAISYPLPPYDVLIHLAAPVADPRGSRSTPLVYYRSIIDTTLRLLSYHHPSARFLYASSSIAVFPDTSPYAAAKAVAERMVMDQARSKDFPYIILRPFVVAGAVDSYGEAHSPETHLVPLAVSCLLTDSTLTVNTSDSSRGAIRDYVHLMDVVSAFECALSPKIPSGIYEVGTGLGSSIMDVTDIVGCRISYADSAHEPPALVSKPSRWLPGWLPRSDLAQIIASDRAWRSHLQT